MKSVSKFLKLLVDSLLEARDQTRQHGLGLDSK